MKDYELKDELGKGAYSTVYRARRLSDNREVALKRLALPPGIDAFQEESLLERFRSEAETARKLNHPNIVPIVDAGEDEGSWYIAFNYTPGDSLQNILSLSGALAPSRVIAISTQIASGLSYAHEHGIIHRDIKPGNIIISPDGNALLSDFGVATVLGGETRSSEEGVAFIGTPQYACPEQATASRVDERSDIFSLGAVMYEMSSGKPAFGGDSLGEIIHKVTSVQAEPIRNNDPSFPPELENIIFKCLSKDPSFRYQHASDLTAALQALASGGAPIQDLQDTAVTSGQQDEGPSLIILQGPREGEEIRLHPSITTIGRKTGDITFVDDDKLENQHAWITKEEAGYFLYDAGTSSGTFVSGNRIERIGLNNGDEISIGGQRFIYSGISASTAKTKAPLKPADVLPPKRGLVSQGLLPWAVGAGVILVIFLTGMYFLRIAPEKYFGSYDTLIAGHLDSWEMSFVDVEFESVQELVYTASAFTIPSIDEIEEGVTSTKYGYVPGIETIRQTHIARLRLLKDVLKSVEVMAGAKAGDQNAITQLEGLIGSIREAEFEEKDSGWENRMLKATAALEGLKSVLSTSIDPGLPGSVSREDAATALYKAYMAFTDNRDPFEMVYNYFLEAEVALQALQKNPRELDFADYNLAVCYYLSGIHLTDNSGDHSEALWLQQNALNYAKKFRGKSSVTEGFIVIGVDKKFYNPTVLLAHIGLALDRLNATGTG